MQWGQFPTARKGEQLEREARKSDASHALADLRARGKDWQAAIVMAKSAYGGYGVAPLSADPTKQNTKQNTKKTK